MKTAMRMPKFPCFVPSSFVIRASSLVLLVALPACAEQDANQAENPIHSSGKQIQRTTALAVVSHIKGTELGEISDSSTHPTRMVEIPKFPLPKIVATDFDRKRLSLLIGHWDTGVGCGSYLHLRSDGTGTLLAQSGSQDFVWTIAPSTGNVEIPLVFKAFREKDNQFKIVEEKHVLILQLDVSGKSLSQVDGHGPAYNRSGKQSGFLGD